MTDARNRTARFVRLAGGFNGRVSVGVASTPYTTKANCVAFRLANVGTTDVFFTTDGSVPTVLLGFPLLAGQDLGWTDCVGSLALAFISSVAAQRVEVWEALDQ